MEPVDREEEVIVEDIEVPIVVEDAYDIKKILNN